MIQIKINLDEITLKTDEIDEFNIQIDNVNDISFITFFQYHR